MIAGTVILVHLANMNTTSDVRTLLVDAHEHLASIVTQALAVDNRQTIDVGIETELLYMNELWLDRGDRVVEFPRGGSKKGSQRVLLVRRPS